MPREEFCQPGLARGRARARDVAAHQGVNQTRLADIGPAHERHFTKRSRGKPSGAGRARDELAVTNRPLSRAFLESVASLTSDRPPGGASGAVPSSQLSTRPCRHQVDVHDVQDVLGMSARSFSLSRGIRCS